MVRIIPHEPWEMLMTLDETVLQKLGEWHPPREGRQTLVVTRESSGWVVSVTSERHDELGSSVVELGVRRQAAGAAPVTETLAVRAQRIAGRLSGFGDTLQVLE